MQSRIYMPPPPCARLLHQSDKLVYNIYTQDYCCASHNLLLASNLCVLKFSNNE
jgi:hypothetical protein